MCIFHVLTVRGLSGSEGASAPCMGLPGNAKALLATCLVYHSVCVCVCVCVRMSIRSFLPPRASRPRNKGTYVFNATRKNFYIRDFR